ncbi:MAG: ferritin-like domain-containing protein [Candidatus Methylomirabilis sp.]|nr:ferritin-like domain-containing protein [Deltaproteobacteria bacterium]
MLAQLKDKVIDRFRPSWPPYYQMDDLMAQAVAGTEEKMSKLEKLYHKTQTHAWDGKAVLQGLIEKHGGINIDEETKRSIATVFSIILWGELAAWRIAADLADRIEDVDAKMAATGQAFDEARHFYVMRDYLARLNIEIPKLDIATQVLLDSLINETNVLKKVMGMQLLVETIALTIFQTVRELEVEPVLSELLRYYEIDEARHVGLGVMYVPKLLNEASRWQIYDLNGFQVKVFVLLTLGSFAIEKDLRRMGLSTAYLNRVGYEKQMAIYRDMINHGRFKGWEMFTEQAQQPWVRIADWLFPPETAKGPKRKRDQEVPVAGYSN